MSDGELSSSPVAENNPPSIRAVMDSAMTRLSDKANNAHNRFDKV